MVSLAALAIVSLALVLWVFYRRRKRVIIVPRERTPTPPPPQTKGRASLWGGWTFLSLVWGLFVLAGILTNRPVLTVVSALIWIWRLRAGTKAQSTLNERLATFHDALPRLVQGWLALEMAGYAPKEAMETLGALPSNEATWALVVLAQTYTSSAETVWADALRNAVHSARELAATMLARLRKLTQGANSIAFVQSVGMVFLFGVIVLLDRYLSIAGELLAIAFLLLLAVHNSVTDAFLMFGRRE